MWKFKSCKMSDSLERDGMKLNEKWVLENTNEAIKIKLKKLLVFLKCVIGLFW